MFRPRPPRAGSGQGEKKNFRDPSRGGPAKNLYTKSQNSQLQSDFDLTLRLLMSYIYIYIYVCMERLFLMFLDHTQ